MKFIIEQYKEITHNLEKTRLMFYSTEYHSRKHRNMYARYFNTLKKAQHSLALLIEELKLCKELENFQTSEKTLRKLGGRNAITLYYMWLKGKPLELKAGPGAPWADFPISTKRIIVTNNNPIVVFIELLERNILLRSKNNPDLKINYQ